MLILALAVAGAGSLFLAIWGHPRRAFVVWLLTLTMIPPWVGVHFLVAVPLHCIVAIMALAAVVFHSRLTFSKYDLYFAFFIAVCFGVLAANEVEAHALVIIAVHWVIPYLAARVLVSATGTRFAVDAISVAFVVVGALAIVELGLNWHPFTGWSLGSSSTSFEQWSRIQYRAGAPRSEWAFGHSIAMGGSLALSIPFVARSSFSDLGKVIMFLMIGGGVVTSASRSAIVAALLTAVICVVNARRLRTVRALSIVLSGIGGVLTLTLLLPQLSAWVLGASRGDRLSAQYRGEIYERFLPRVEWFSPYDVYAAGDNVVDSIDSAVLGIGLRFGWLVLLLAALPLLLMVIRVVGGSSSPADVALVGQLPLFATVALITQYQNLIFVVLAFAATMRAAPAGESANTAAPADGLNPVDSRGSPSLARRGHAAGHGQPVTAARPGR